MCECSKDTQTLTLRNATLLPVAWRLTGLDTLGDDFSVSQESGVVQAKTDFILNVFFRALKPVTTNRKAVRIEVISCTMRYYLPSLFFFTFFFSL